MKILNALLDSLRSDIYIDLGTANTLVMDRKRGLIANEPSVVAYHESGPNRRHIVAVGEDAKRTMGRTPGDLVASFPLKDGVIADLESTRAMILHFMKQAGLRSRYVRPRLVISLPFGVSAIEKQAVRESGMTAGAREVVLIEEPMAAAIGAGLPIEEPIGNMVIDIGGGTTEIAVISLYDIVHCEAVRIGGHRLDQAIVSYIRRQFNLIVGDQSAERLKIQIGSAVPDLREDVATIRGVDFVTGLPKEITVSSYQVYEAIAPLLDDLVTAARRTLEHTPPELLGDIIENGVVLAGGGALIRDIDERIRRDLGIPVHIAEDPLLAIARGGQRALENQELLRRIEIF